MIKLENIKENARGSLEISLIERFKNTILSMKKIKEYLIVNLMKMKSLK